MANAHHSAEEIRERIDYDPETGIFCWKRSRAKKIKPGQKAGNVHPEGYLRIRIDDVMYKAHRLAWIIMTGRWPDGVIDHINRINSDNRWTNLRDVPQSKNAQNTMGRKKTISGVKGVYWHTQNHCWRSQICINQKIIHLGVFETIEEALKVRLEAERKYFTHSPACEPPGGSLYEICQQDETGSASPSSQ